MNLPPLLSSSTPPIPAPAALMDCSQMQVWLAALRGKDVLPCRQSIRAMRADGMPHGKLLGGFVYDPVMVWAWIQNQMVVKEVRQIAIDAAVSRRGRNSRVA